MTESPDFRRLDTPFSTADAADIDIGFQRGDLVLRFTDWQENPVTVRFSDAAAFSWQNDARLPDGMRDDESYEVLDSPLMSELAGLDALDRDVHHYRLCFNACGVLDVVSGAIVVESQHAH